jgi:hypothetical protein
MTSRAIPLLFLLASGCAGVGEAAGAVALGAVVAGVRRANGECYTPCNPGFACDKEKGTCEPLPCGGKCNFDQKCEPTPTGEQCVNVKTVP